MTSTSIADDGPPTPSHGRFDSRVIPWSFMGPPSHSPPAPTTDLQLPGIPGDDQVVALGSSPERHWADKPAEPEMDAVNRRPSRSGSPEAQREEETFRDKGATK